ncbi:MAG: hypothetical protein ABSD28_03440 [Tepidisphaeraceae bacterium]|jgi:hypothetical protein
MRTHHRAFAAWVGTWTGSFVASAALLGCLASGARAALLLPGGSIPTTGGGTYGVAKVYDSGPVPFVSLSSVYSGLLDSQVWDEAGGTLDFVYQFSSSPNSGDSIKRFSVTDFEGLTTYADDTPVGGGSAFPTSVDRSALGDVIGFNFATPVAPGATTYQMVIDTNATAFSPNGGTASWIDGDVAFTAVPTPIPEPASGALAAIALSSLALRPRKTSRLS